MSSTTTGDRVNFCPTCGSAVGQGANFCARCGSSLEAAAPVAPPTEQLPAPPAPAPFVPPKSISAPARERLPVNGYAVASLVLGILWIYWVGSVLALIFGYIGQRHIKASNGEQSGEGIARAGMILGWVGLGALVFILLTIVAHSATQP
jgi:hypothetical protein